MAQIYRRFVPVDLRPVFINLGKGSAIFRQSHTVVQLLHGRIAVFRHIGLYQGCRCGNPVKVYIRQEEVAQNHSVAAVCL